MSQAFIIPTMNALDDEQFFQLCQSNRHSGSHFERDKNGKIYFMSPTGSIGGFNDGEIFIEIKIWSRQSGKGYAFGPATGFLLPDKSIKSPDVAWIKKERWAKIPKDLRKKFAPICPDFVVEVKSETDGWEELIEKMKEWVANGCRLGWLIDPTEKLAMVFTPENIEPQKQPFSIIDGAEVLEGLKIDLRTIFEDLEAD